MSDEKHIDEHSGVETTGHEWDGIRELNNPLPRWWLIIWYATIVWSVVYWVLMPAWPGITGYTKGLRNHSERANVAADMEALRTVRAESAAALLEAPSLQAIENDPDLLQFATALGKSAFGDNCATCHGAGGQGFPGYPNLNDDDWLWGGSLDEIRQTITVGIRSGHEDQRFSQMPAFGRDGVLNRDQLSDVTDYVLSLSGSEHDAEAAARGAEAFQANCTVCHGENGAGDPAQGAPNLTDQIWLFGGDRETIRETIYGSRYGVMPTWDERLDDATIAALSVYVHSLGGGE